MFNKYDKYLSLELSDNYWSDEGISEARFLLEKFTTSDWDLLIQTCIIKPIPWAIRCAETLGDDVQGRDFDVLLMLLDSGNNEVTIAVLDSINSLASLGFDISLYSKKLICSLNSVKENAGWFERVLLDSLDKKLL